MGLIELFFYALVVHYIADFSFQSSFISEYKQKSIFVMFVHVMIWTGCLFGFLNLAGFVAPFWLIAANFAVHFLTDDAKCWLLNEKGYIKDEKATYRLFHADQLVHIVQVLLTCLYFIRL